MTDKSDLKRQPPSQLGARDAARARRHAAVAVRRDVRGDVPDAGRSSTPAPSRPRRASRTRTPAIIYSAASRNPTVAMFEERMRLLEGAEAARATATGMAAVDVGAAVLPQGRRSHRCGARHVRLVPLRRAGAVSRASASPARWSTAATLDAWQRAVQPNTKVFFFETPANPTLDLVDIAAVSRDRPRGRRAGHRRQRVRHAAAAEAAQARRRRRRLLRHQAHRRPGPLPRRRGAVLAEVPQGPPAHVPAPDRPDAEPVQRLGDAQGPGDLAAARARAMRERPRRSPTISAGQKGIARVLYCGRPDYPQAGARQAADVRSRHARHLRGGGRQGRRPSASSTRSS